MSVAVELDLAGYRARAEAAAPGPWLSAGVPPYDIKGSTVTIRDEPPDRFVVKHVWLSEQGRCTRFLAECRETAGYSDMEATAAHIAGMDPPTTIALVDEVERLAGELERAVSSIAELTSRAIAAETENTKLRVRAAELESAEEAAESAEDEQHGQDAADKAVMSLEAMAFNWIATTDIHKAIAAASKIAGPHANKLGSCIHGLVSQAWIEGAGTGFDARRKLMVAAREQIAEFELLFAMTREADRRGVAMWRKANPGNDLVLPDRGDLVAWLVEQLATRGGDAQ